MVILDGDELRDLYDNKLGYDLDSEKNMQRYIKLSIWHKSMTLIQYF